jgi:hypothetical protein
MKRTAVLGAVLAGLMAVPAIASAGTLYVNHISSPTGSDSGCSTAAYGSVQGAVSAAKSGDQVYLCTSVPYVESVAIQNKQLNLLGDPGATIQAPANAAAPTTFFSSQNLLTPNSVLTIIGPNINVHVTGLTIEGPFQNAGCGGDDFGILAIGGPAVQLGNDQVLNIGAADQAGLGGCQYGVGIQIGRRYWPNTTGGFNTVNFAANAQIQNAKVAGYQKNGITVDGPGSQAQIQSSNIDGGGQNPIIARNGIQISRGATGQVQNNSVNNNEYTGPGSFASATGILVFGGCGDPTDNNVQINNNSLTNNDTGVDDVNYDPTCTTAPSNQTNNQVHDNTIVKNDGVTNNSPFTDEFGRAYTGYQVGVGNTGNNDQIHDNHVSSTDGAFGPSTTPGGEFLAPIDIQTYPPTGDQVHGNTYNGSPTNPPY